MSAFARRVASVPALLVVVGVSAAAQQAATSHEMHGRHGDPKAYIASLEDPRRDAYQKPAEVVEALGLMPGQVVADIGAGSGYFAVRLAEPVGETGRVLAVDVNAHLLEFLEERAREASLGNIATILAPPDDPRLPEGGDDDFLSYQYFLEFQPTGPAAADQAPADGRR